MIGSNNLPAGNKITFSQDGQVPTYTVNVSEGTTTYTPSNNPEGLELTHTVNQTIYYVYSNGKQAAPDATAQVTFQRNATKNDITGEITYTGWTPASQEFPAVTSPEITGYTPNAKESMVIGVNENSEDNVQTITYTANPEHAVVNYVDSATGKVVASQTVDGTFGGSVTYDPTNTENQLKGKGYVIGSNNLPAGNKITFSQDGQVPTYTVNVSEGTTTYTPSNNPEGLELTHTVNQTIYYVYSNGKQAAPDATAQVTFQRNATKNDITGEITYTGWTPASQEFPAVTSPEITGYTPNAKESMVIGVNENSEDNVQTITYTANPEHAVVNYVDSATGKVVASQTVDGTFGGSVTYDPTNTENQLKGKGYVIGSNNLPAGNKITFSQDGQVPTYTVNVSEGTTTYTPSNNPEGLDLTKTVTRTINYVNSDGKRLAPSVTQTVTFQRNATKNDVTGEITYTNWTPASQEFPAVTSPKITGYTSNVTASTALGVNENSTNSTQTITYTANSEHAVVNYVDSATGKVVTSQTVDGTFGGSVTYDPTNTENQLKGKGYVIGSNNLPAGNKITFSQDGQVPTYTVNVSEGTTTYTPSNNPEGLDLTKTVTRTINYVNSDGKRLAPSVTQTVTFQRSATVNNVTGKLLYGNWQLIGSDKFNAVVSPSIKGYVTTQTVIDAEDNISINSIDQIVNVVYAASKPAELTSQPSKPDKKVQAPTQVQKLPVRVQTINKISKTVTQPSKNALPQTGEKYEKQNLWGSLLIGLSGILSLLGLSDRKEKR